MEYQKEEQTFKEYQEKSHAMELELRRSRHHYKEENETQKTETGTRTNRLQEANEKIELLEASLTEKTPDL